jgi:alanine racemase
VIAELEIDLGAIRANVRRLAELVRPARFAAVVKANAYGHGLEPVAQAIGPEVDAMCVYRTDEATALRGAGITCPILILGPIEPCDLAFAHQARAAMTMWSRNGFRRDAAAVARRGGRRFDVHAKIDTGVTRLGLEPDGAAEAIAAYLSDPDFDLRGVYTHLAAAEELESEFTLAQLATFRRALAPLDGVLRERRVARHAAASAAAILFPALRLDLVRAGIATYGIWPSPQTRAAASEAIELEPALTWRTNLVVVREVEAGRSIGYGCTFHTARRSRIGVLPIGYAEGIPRSAGGRAEVLIAGKRAPIVGRICMNMAFVDVTDVPLAHAGSSVTLIGADGDERIDANDLGEHADTIGYEIVARLPAEIPRRYLAREAAIVARTS